MFKADDSVRSVKMKWRSTRFSGVPELSGRADIYWCHTLGIDGLSSNLLYNEIDPNLSSTRRYCIGHDICMAAVLKDCIRRGFVPPPQIYHPCLFSPL